jgi:SpoVK/Ycf46/Vps4 family AAA+-type ATPase
MADQPKSPLLTGGFAAPDWAQDMARKYASSALSLFILTGNVLDMVAYDSGGKKNFDSLPDFLSNVFFARRSLVMTYDLSNGIQCPKPEMRQAVMSMVKAIDTARGSNYYEKGLPKDPLAAIELVSRIVRTRLSSGQPEDKRIAVVIKYAETVFPETDAATAAVTERAVSIALSELVNDPDVLSNDVTIVLVTEAVPALSKRVQSSPYGAVLNIPLPAEDVREAFIKRVNATAELDLTSDVVEALKVHTSGLTLVQIRALLQEAKLGNVDFGRPDYIYKRKREMIEQECRGLLEFIAPQFRLDMVAVHTRAVEELKRDAQLVVGGHLDAVPMGYLLTGPAGVGKSFLIKCFAGEMGIPCVELKNFRDKWVGATEQNLEKIITVLAGLAPVACIIDEADAYLGTRESGGDSGVSSRVFSRLTSFMGDTANRGKILWFLITNRPDLLAIDLKRQGRAEKHIPLFPPETEEDYESLFDVFCRKSGLLAEFKHLFGEPPDGAGLKLTDMSRHGGADLEALLVRAKGVALLAGRQSISIDDIVGCLADYLSPVYPQQVEYQILQAIAESTSRALIPERWHIPPDELAARIERLRPFV